MRPLSPRSDCRLAWVAILSLAAMLTGVLSPNASVARAAEQLTCDVCVVGGGSGGIGASVAAARAGAQVILIEKQPKLGGTSCRAYVNNWEPGPGSPLSREIFDRLKQQGVAGVTRDHNFSRGRGPFALFLVDPELPYEASLRRAGVPRRKWHSVTFEPEAYHRLVMEMLDATGNCRVLLSTAFTQVEPATQDEPSAARGKRLEAILAESEDGQRKYRIQADVFIDCTGDVYVCRAAGCPVMVGPEPRERFDEPSAPKVVRHPHDVNAVALCYRITPSDNPKRQEKVRGGERYPRAAHVTGLPGGDLIVNTLGLVAGREFIEHGYAETRELAEPRALTHWSWLQQREPFSDYELHSLAPMLGIREGYRVVGEYVLRQQDLMAGSDRQPHDDIIALADHALDVHRASGGSRAIELKQPYGVPYRCLIPRGWDNLMVACRGASFSQIAASSCRLCRTMIAMGEAAGQAAAQAARRDVPVDQVDLEPIQQSVGLSR